MKTKNLRFRTGQAVFTHVNKSTAVVQQKKKKQDEDAVEEEENANIVRAAFSKNMFAAASNDKTVFVWNFTTGTLLAKCTMKKKVSCVTFSNDGTEILFADKFGDVYSSPIDQTKTDVTMQPELRLGHISLLTDMFITRDGKYIVTSDRDEKVRITQYPETYIIQSFLLGHKEAVWKIAQLSDDCT